MHAYDPHASPDLRPAPVRHLMPEPRPDVLGAPVAARVRRFQQDGQTWTVREWPPSSLYPHTTTTLVFESPSAMRRVRTYPADWFTCTDAELDVLSRGR